MVLRRADAEFRGISAVAAERGLLDGDPAVGDGRVHKVAALVVEDVDSWRESGGEELGKALVFRQRVGTP